MKKICKPVMAFHPMLISSLILFTFLLGSCASKMTFETSPVVPAAEGYVKVKKNSNNNYNIQLDVKRLAAPERLNPPMDKYMVWMKSDNGPIRNLGELTTSSSLLSKTLKSSLETSSPTKPQGFFITAEKDGNVSTPGYMVVLETKD